MASKYKILDIAELGKIMVVDLTQFKDSEGNRVYSDPQIEKQISKAEVMVFGTTKKRYRLESDQTSSYEIIPDQVLEAVETMAELRMKNQLIKDGFETGEIYDVILYYNELVKPLIESEKVEGELITITPVDDYEIY